MRRMDSASMTGIVLVPTRVSALHRPHLLQRDLEERAVAAGAAGAGRSIEIAIAALDQIGRGICAVAAAPGEGVQNRLSAARRELEDGAETARAALIGGSIKIAIAALDHTGIGMFAVAAPGEEIQNPLGAARGDLEHRAGADRG